MMPSAVETPKYWSVPEDGPTLRAELDLIPDGSKVLEIGTAAGHMTQALVRKGCTVVGVEIDGDQARRAAPFCKRVIVRNLEHLDLDAELPERFDVVLCGDVLEHLVDPTAALAKLKRRLVPSGFLVISIPNVAHGSVRLSLLEGRFRYAPSGLLDATHLRFFTLASIVDLFNTVGLGIRDLRRTRIGLFDSEIPLDPSRVNASLVARILDDPEATSYQFIFRAFTSGSGSRLSELQDRAFNPAQERHRFAADAMERAWVAFHEHPRRLRAARAWARLAMHTAPSVKAVLYWVASFTPLALWRR